jgi:lipoprotein-releasing system permease protein
VALASLGVCVVGAALMPFAATSSVGVTLLVSGMLAAAVFGLLSTFSVFTSVSVFGVALGVAALVVVLSVTTGFQHQFRDKVLGVNAHVIVRKSSGGMPDYKDVMQRAQAIDPDVVAVQPFLFHEVLVTMGRGGSAGVAIKGVDPARVNQVLDLGKHIIEGNLESLAAPAQPGGLPPMLIGKELATKLGAKLGETITVVIPFSNIDPKTGRSIASQPRLRKFRITGIFYCGFDEYDRRLVYASLTDTQELVGSGDYVLGVELKVKNVDRADEIAAELQDELGMAYEVVDWYELNKNLFTALALQRLALVIILTLIILVAAVNMVSALTMMVTDKTREIAILKSMGARTGGIAGVFQVVGLAIGGVGIAIGLVIGLVTCHVMTNYGYRLDPRVYLIDRLPIEIRPFEVVVVVCITLVICLIATLVPARTAAALRPVDGLRYD